MEVSVVNYSKLIEHPEFRVDAECYKPYHLDIEKKIVANGFKLIDDYSISVINFGAYSLCNHIVFQDKGKPFLVTLDIKNNVINTSNLHYISEEVHELLHKSHCVKDQVLLTMAGAYLGQAAVFQGDFECSSNQAIAKITLKNSSINPYYLSTFLNCKYGQSQIERYKTGTGQPNFNLGLIKQLKIVDATNIFQLKIADVIIHALKLLNDSKLQFSNATLILISELGLINWEPKHQLTFIKNYSDTQEAERIDAEYYQPKYEDIIKAIRNYSGGWDTLDNLVCIKKCIEVGSGEYLDEGIPFVRVSNVSPFEITEEKYISDSLYKELTPQEDDIAFEKSKNHQPQQGEILFSKDGTPGIARYLKDEPPKMIPSGGILRLKNKADKVNNEYLTLVLNSILTQEQVNRDVGGSIILHWRPDQVKKTVIPILSEAKQLKIQQKVTESFNFRKQSKHLLESAKKAVEMAIEQDEQTAMQWLKNEVHEMQI